MLTKVPAPVLRGAVFPRRCGSWVSFRPELGEPRADLPNLRELRHRLPGFRIPIATASAIEKEAAVRRLRFQRRSVGDRDAAAGTAVRDRSGSEHSVRNESRRFRSTPRRLNQNRGAKRSPGSNPGLLLSVRRLAIAR
jgi:hypothetical protein